MAQAQDRNRNKIRGKWREDSPASGAYDGR
jgi:hypothetical protein